MSDPYRAPAPSRMSDEGLIDEAVALALASPEELAVFTPDDIRRAEAVQAEVDARGIAWLVDQTVAAVNY